MALAGLLFLASALWAGGAREAIRVDKATQDFLIKQRAELLLRPLTPEEKKQVVDDFIVEEILVREAKKRGLDNSIHRMRYHCFTRERGRCLGAPFCFPRQVLTRANTWPCESRLFSSNTQLVRLAAEQSE